MKNYIGTKQLLAKPMTLGEYNKYRGWDLPTDEDGNKKGYLVEYVDSTDANHPDHKGYISWSPVEAFEKAYRTTDGLTFGLAIEALKQGKKVARKGWNGKGMWLRYINPYHNTQYSIAELSDIEGTLMPYIAMKTVDNGLIPWLANQTDIIIEDWIIVE